MSDNNTIVILSLLRDLYNEKSSHNRSHFNYLLESDKKGARNASKSFLDDSISEERFADKIQDLITTLKWKQ